MIYRLKTSKETAEIFHELESKTGYKPYVLVKHAIAWSLRLDERITDFSTDQDGLDLNRYTIVGDYDTYFKILMELAEGRFLSDEEYFPRYMKAHIDRGSKLLRDEYAAAGGIEKYIERSLGKGDTV